MIIKKLMKNSGKEICDLRELEATEILLKLSDEIGFSCGVSCIGDCDPRELEVVEALSKLSDGGGLSRGVSCIANRDLRKLEAAKALSKLSDGGGLSCDLSCIADRDLRELEAAETLSKLSDESTLSGGVSRIVDRDLDMHNREGSILFKMGLTETMNKKLTKKSGKEMRDPVQLEAAKVLLKLSDGGGVSFSIVHLLSAVRIALITPESRKSELTYGKSSKATYKKQKHSMDIHSEAHEGSLQIHQNESNIFSDRSPQKILSSFTTDEIVRRVKLTPGDARVLELSIPLRDLVRGVLMIFMSNTEPPGAKNCQSLTSYDKVNKTWSWVGPVSSDLPLTNGFEKEVSSKAWGVPCSTLSKLVVFYAHWLKVFQEVFRKIQSLPPPPLTLMQCLSVRERFKDGKARKHQVTLSPSCEEVREYFRREEALRYSISEHAFSYTARDGKKSSVAPLRRISGKPALRIREHFILKQDRPPQFTVLCLVRDAAARLPDQLGTRLDICTLARDSQFIIEDVSDSQIIEVISGALDRLHYEVDPCVRFHQTWRLWLYLHADREEEDFDPDGTCSRKVRKKNSAKLAGKSSIGEGSA